MKLVSYGGHKSRQIDARKCARLSGNEMLGIVLLLAERLWERSDATDNPNRHETQ